MTSNTNNTLIESDYEVINKPTDESNQILEELNKVDSLEKLNTITGKVKGLSDKVQTEIDAAEMINMYIKGKTNSKPNFKKRNKAKQKAAKAARKKNRG